MKGAAGPALPELRKGGEATVQMHEARDGLLLLAGIAPLGPGAVLEERTARKIALQEAALVDGDGDGRGVGIWWRAQA
jgi:hypothetical protein